MKFAVFIVILMGLSNVENRMFRHNYINNEVSEQDPEPTPPHPLMNFVISPDTSSEEVEHEPVTSIKQEGKASIMATENTEDEYTDDNEQGKLLHKLKEKLLNWKFIRINHSMELMSNRVKQSCAVMVHSSIQSPMQSLIRKYRYNAQGALIPSSVKYFIKVPQGYGPPVLVPLNGKSLSHLGGFVRYYKEVPPIPLAW